MLACCANTTQEDRSTGRVLNVLLRGRTFDSFSECQRSRLSPHPVLFLVIHARVAELVDALDLGSSGINRGGSSPPSRTPQLFAARNR
jgi:hypothetical protein